MNNPLNELINDFNRHLAIGMFYHPGTNNLITGLNRRKLTAIIAVRFGIISPTLVSWLYQTSRHQALEHLNKLAREGLLVLVKTHRSNDGRIYVPTYSAAKYAEQLTGIQTYFRSKANPQLSFNHNTVMHDLINAFVLLRGIHNWQTDEKYNPFWQGFVTEKEFKRITSKDVRNVDGLVQEDSGALVAIEIEHSFKNKTTRRQILLKYLSGIKAGYYSKVFLVSHSLDILNDAKRLNNQIIEELTSASNSKFKKEYLSDDDAALLEASIIYRTKFCNEINELFYQ
ncbi:hypothetical protein [Pseudoalteromonas sp. G4]|uniref:hypothetical protein n=1 Tax=Pseudoalteromonas sp. G4 TaxID=2992761 RepID=UPI00237E3B3F|nr:hypothetical protein [Pseudoalteromonas sp. G4]MDE3274358.1 hypothetical protein [Pseudoalteromonas sp. G4]